jgi:glyoxylase-like metal-dependent hydrolase (beta-lactamase superfamily II)
MARGAAVAIAVVLTASVAGLAQGGITPPKISTPRLYIFDCGVIKGLGVELFGFKKDEVPIRDFFVACYLVAHPKGTLMWDVGVIPDSAFKSDGSPVTEGASTVSKPLLPQLAALGYTPADITYLAMSHYHSDHTANANAFAGSTWLVRAAERDGMFAEKPAGIIEQATFSALKTAKTTILDK